jgi:hypothetical protein
MPVPTTNEFPLENALIAAFEPIDVEIRPAATP